MQRFYKANFEWRTSGEGPNEREISQEVFWPEKAVGETYVPSWSGKT
jgi:hypothetical protein